MMCWECHTGCEHHVADVLHGANLFHAGTGGRPEFRCRVLYSGVACWRWIRGMCLWDRFSPRASPDT